MKNIKVYKCVNDHTDVYVLSGLGILGPSLN